MPTKRHSVEQIIAKLREVEKLTGQGMSIGARSLALRAFGPGVVEPGSITTLELDQLQGAGQDPCPRYPRLRRGSVRSKMCIDWPQRYPGNIGVPSTWVHLVFDKQRSLA